ncbi:phosphatidylinositol phosphatase PTPRQ [Centroberyx gerrardi]
MALSLTLLLILHLGQAVSLIEASSTNTSHIVNTNDDGPLPGPPLGLEGERVGSNGILISWTMPTDARVIIVIIIIRYRKVCPYPDPGFTQVTRYLDVPETLLNGLTPGSTYSIQVAAETQAGTGAYSKPLYINTAEAPPGLVTNLTAFAQNHTFVVLTWFLPRRINGLITKFAVKAKHARTGQTIRMLEINAEDIMNDAADILSHGMPSPSEVTASSPPITAPPAASWSVPISVGVGQLRPYTAYLFEVSAFTSDGEGQIASIMVRMPESGYMYENSTTDMEFVVTGLNPYTKYTVAVRAKSAGEVGPEVQADVVTLAEVQPVPPTSTPATATQEASATATPGDPGIVDPKGSGILGAIFGPAKDVPVVTTFLAKTMPIDTYAPHPQSPHLSSPQEPSFGVAVLASVCLVRWSDPAFPMGGTERLWLLAGLCQVVFLTCEQRSDPVVVEVVFQPFPANQDPEGYTVTCKTASNHMVLVDPIDHSACSPDCKMLLRLVEDPGGYNITLRADRSDTTLEAKTFHFIPVSLSSLHVYSTTTTALLTWKLKRGQHLSILHLYNTHTQSVTHIFHIDSSERQSQYTVKGLQPGTRFKAKIVVTTFLTHLNMILKQQLSIGMETAQCPIGWLANQRSCYTVRRRGLAWSDAQHSCRDLAAGTHLADLKTQEDLLFMSSHLLTHNNLLLLWTGLNDQQDEGQPRWSDGSAYNLTNSVTSLLPANQTDCFALQRNATGPGYFLTPFFCNIPLPFICQFQTPPVPAFFSFDLVQVTEQEVELHWSDLSPLNSLDRSTSQIFLQYQQEAKGESGQREEDRSRRRNGKIIGEGEKGTQSHSRVDRIVHVPVSLSSRGVTVAGLSPGRVYSFTLRASHPSGSSWSLGQTRTAYTRPLPPQNITVGLITVSQISVHWMLPDSQYVIGWTFVVRYMDMTSRQERIAGMANISTSSGTGGLQSYTAVIGGLESYRKYRVGVYTVTQHGVESCGQAPLTVQTAVSAPSGLVVWSVGGNLTACWASPPDDPPDGYYITSHPLRNPSPTAMWINQSSPSALWVNESVCVVLGALTPGQTYKVGVSSLRAKDKSQRTSIVHTTDPWPVQVAIPLSVGTSSAQLYIQRPQLGLVDGVKVCVCQGVCDDACEGVCEYMCDWHSLPTGTHMVTLNNLSPGSEYQLRVYSTSRERTGPPYYARPIRTSLAPPSKVREGVVTDSSIELRWDPAQGQAHSYEVMCFDCDRSLMVQKVFSQSAVFSSLTPGRLYHFAVRTEKESFTDSPPVTVNITAAPSPVEVSIFNKTTSSIGISWGTVRGVVSGFILSSKNRTSNQKLNLSPQEPRSHTFEGLAPGSQYTIEMISTSGEKRSKPATIILHTIPEGPQELVLAEQVVTSVFVSWRSPPGQVDGYKLVFGLLSVDRRSWHEVLVQSTSYEINDLIPGSDYGVSIHSMLGSDISQAVHREFNTRPAGLCALHLLSVNSSSATVSWDSALGEFDFHRVTVANASVTHTLTVPKEERLAMVTGLVAGCSYNVSAERVRGVLAGSAAFLTVTTVPTRVRGVCVVNVSARAFSLRWEQSEGCVDQYQVSLLPNQGEVTVHPTRDGYIQADVDSVSPGTQFTVSVTAASSSNISPPVSRIVNTNESPLPGPPFGLEGERVGSNGILISWTTPADAKGVLGYVIRYKEVCPYPDPGFTLVTRYLDVPETLLNGLTPGSTYSIQVAAETQAGTGAYSKPLYIKTAEAPPGLVTNLTAFAQNHTFVVLTWFLPRRINGLITKFAVKAKHARTGQTVRMLEINAEDIMTVALPHCNDAADILSRGTPSPSEVTASSPPITISAVPPAASWSVPISVGVDQLRPYSAYLFEVSAFTSDGEGQIGSTMVRMPESAPEDPPQNLTVWNMTSKSISMSWEPPTIITGRFTYVIYLYGPTGYMYEHSTTDMQFVITDLNPYTKYTVAVRAKSAGEVGPEVQTDVVTPAEAPSAVQELRAIAEDSVSIRVSWKSPAQPNGMITQYRLQVLAGDTLQQDITLTGEADLNTTGLYEDGTFPPELSDRSDRRKRSAELSQTTSPPAFTATISDRTLLTSITASSLTHSGPTSSDSSTNTDAQLNPDHSPTVDPTATETPSTTGTGLTSKASGPDLHTAPTLTSEPAVSGTSALSLTSVPPATPLPWLTHQSQTMDMTSDPDPLTLTPGQPHPSTRDVAITGHFSTRTAAVSGTTGGVTVREEVVDVRSEELSYLVSDLNPFTEYTFKVTASTAVGAGPATNITEKTREQVPSSVLDVSYQNISSTSILLSWIPPLNPNGWITHYTVYGLKLHSNQALQRIAYNTSILLTDLDKYTGYKLRVAASTAVGESSLSDEDDIFVFTSEDEPDSPPENLTVVETRPSTATLTWSPPEKANGVIRQYEVLYENQSYSAVVNSSSPRVTLSSLKPFSYYNVSVRAFTRYGHGNQTSDTLLMLSGEDVPGSPPYDLSYESVSPSEVNVTWQPPLVPNGVIIHYSLELWNSTHYLSLTSPSNFIHITHLKKYARYRIMVQAHTRVGPGNYSSEPLNITTLEDAPDTPPQFLHAKKLSDYEVELSWKPPREANSDILYYVVRVWNETGDVWQNVTETSVVVNVDSESRYNASVSSWTKLGDGGVMIFISFTTTDAEPFDAPQNVSFVNMTTSSVTLLWYPPTEPNGIILYYTIYYSDNITVAEQRLPVSTLPAPASPDSAFSYTLTGLIGGTNYTLWMTSSTLQGDGGVWSEPLTLITPEDVPNDGVHNLTVKILSSTFIVFSWDPPLEPNGRPFYLLTLQEAGIPPNTGPPAANTTISKSTTDNVLLFTKLRKYFHYVLTVTPATGAGAAHNHTSTMHLRTDDDIPSSAPLVVSTRNLSSSSIAVVWQRPLEANGEITEYALTLSGPTGSNSSHASNTSYTSNTSITLTNLLPYTPYNLSITAATRKGTGPALLLLLHTDEAGPMSPPRNLTIYNHTAFSVWLSWEPSLEPNGVVTHYGFRIRELITHTVTHQNSSGPSTTAHLSGFRPHSSYEISVYSYTRVGHGDEFSRPVTFTTNESVSDAVGNLSCSGVSWDSIQMSWDLPANPNGQITFYQILVESDVQNHTHMAHTPEYTVTGLSADQEYTLTVTAVNSAGPGDQINCTAATHPESVPGVPRSLNISQVTIDSVTLHWTPPLSSPGLLKNYHIIVQLLSTDCEPDIPTAAEPAPEQELAPDCVDSEGVVLVNVSDGSEGNRSFTLPSLAKYRYYRFRLAAETNAGVGEHTPWIYTRTLAGNPDAPPRGLKVTPKSNSLRIQWDAPAVLSGPTSYLVHIISLDDAGLNQSMIRAPGERKDVVMSNLTAFTLYSVTVIAFTGPLEDAARDGKASNPTLIRTLEEVPKDPPKNVTLAVFPEVVTRVMVTFTPPEEPNGNISAYSAHIYQQDKLFMTVNLNIIQKQNGTLTAFIDGLKGGHSYSIRIAAENGAGKSPLSPEVQIATGIKAPAKPTQRPQAVLGRGEVAMVTHRSITVRMPACFYSDENGPIRNIQVIVAESGVKDGKNLTDWKHAYFHRPAPYLTDEGFPNPLCLKDRDTHTDARNFIRDGRRVSGDGLSLVRRNDPTAETYVIGENDHCMEEDDTDKFCNGPLKPSTDYVFKFRATNIQGQYTDSEYSDNVKTAVDGLLTRDEQIILGVVLSVSLAALLIMIIYASVKIHQRKKEGGTYSPREAEIIETKYKLDQLIAVADLELKEEKLNRYSSFFFRRKEIYVIQLLSYRKSLKPVNKKSFLQHVEDLCANDNAKFQEEFAELPKLLQDLATSDADLPWNRSKNRFNNIKPYNNNRVKLLSQPGMPGSDYINASFISGYLCPNEFIATQGPLPGTVADFWRMILETGTRTIAMLTQCYEKGRIRCNQYWPDDDKPLSVMGDIIITKLTEDVNPDWTIRALKVERYGECMVVHHFNYTSWPEHGVPESSSTLIQFVKTIRANRHDNTTIVVHCSAGVGRTGVFIALDHLIQHVSDHDFVDVYGLVAELRSERMCMVQNLAQYMFLHQSTLDLLSSKGNSQSIWFVNYSALEKMDSLDAMEGDVELEWEETTM